jgi:hypothetical protein
MEDSCNIESKIQEADAIPEGVYCYTTGSIEKSENNGFLSKTGVCPHYSYKDINGVKIPFCKFLCKGSVPNSLTDTDFEKLEKHFGSEDEVFEGLPLDLLWDQVKECGINFGDIENEEGTHDEPKKIS